MQFNKLVNLILEQLKIVAPAVKFKSGKVYKGKLGEMHAHVHDRIVQRLAAVNNVSYNAAAKRFERMWQDKQVIDGFIDNEGNFRTRQEAFQIAKGHIPQVAEMDKDLKDDQRQMQSEFIPGTRLHPAHA